MRSVNLGKSAGNPLHPRSRQDSVVHHRIALTLSACGERSSTARRLFGSAGGSSFDGRTGIQVRYAGDIVWLTSLGT